MKRHTRSIIGATHWFPAGLTAPSDKNVGLFHLGRRIPKRSSKKRG